MRFGLGQWAAWAPGLERRSDWEAWARGAVPLAEREEPALPMVPAMLRRRADRLARMALQVAYEALGEERGLPVVFVSRHGSVTRSATLLEALALEQPLSPAGFASSVHNAATGLLGIARADRAPCTALAAGDALVAAMLSEAAAFHADGHPRVLGLLCDEAVPAYYVPYLARMPATVAWAGVLDTGSADAALRFTASVDLSHAAADSRDEPILAWIRWLLGDAPRLQAPGLVRGWSVERA